MAERLEVIKTKAGVEDLKAYLADKEVIAFDTETTGVEKDSEIIGFSVCADLELAYYVVLSYWDITEQRLVYLETRETAKGLLDSLKGKQLVAHNAVFDCSMIHNSYGVDLMPSIYVDTMILAHLLNENRRVGLKDLGVSIFGEDADAEQRLMKESVTKNGGVMTKECYELYKGDADLIARYGAKDTILTLKLLYHLLPDLYEQGLDKFFFDDESMPLLRGPTYDLNTAGLKVNVEQLQRLSTDVETECLEDKAYIYKEIAGYVKDKYPGTSKANTFNIGAGQQLSWLLFIKLKEPFGTLTDGGKELCHALGIKIPYTNPARKDFIARVTELKGKEWAKAAYNSKTKKMGRPKKVGDPWQYMSCGKVSMAVAAMRYKWVARLLKYRSNEKLRSTYIVGIQSRMKYGIIRPSFLQHGTTSGRYSSRNPNFQNLPRDDKRVKACIIARPGKVFVGADQSQLEPRVFASLSGDETLMGSFAKGEDFYSVVGSPVFGIHDATLVKDGSPNSFPVKYQKLRDLSKVIALATPYGTLAPQMSSELALKAGIIKSKDECQDIINTYFETYPKVYKLMLDAHAQAKEHGVVYNLFGRPRRIPEAKLIAGAYGKNTAHSDLPRAARTLLNLAMNHRVQSTGASIMNRAAIALRATIDQLMIEDKRWTEVKIVLQVHDELVLEGPEALALDMSTILGHCMETTVTLPGVALKAEPKIAYNLADLK